MSRGQRRFPALTMRGALARSPRRTHQDQRLELPLPAEAAGGYQPGEAAQRAGPASELVDPPPQRPAQPAKGETGNRAHRGVDLQLRPKERERPPEARDAWAVLSLTSAGKGAVPGGKMHRIWSLRGVTLISRPSTSHRVSVVSRAGASRRGQPVFGGQGRSPQANTPPLSPGFTLWRQRRREPLRSYRVACRRM